MFCLTICWTRLTVSLDSPHGCSGVSVLLLFSGVVEVSTVLYLFHWKLLCKQAHYVIIAPVHWKGKKGTMTGPVTSTTARPFWGFGSFGFLGPSEYNQDPWTLLWPHYIVIQAFQLCTPLIILHPHSFEAKLVSFCTPNPHGKTKRHYILLDKVPVLGRPLAWRDTPSIMSAAGFFFGSKVFISSI